MLTQSTQFTDQQNTSLPNGKFNASDLVPAHLTRREKDTPIALLSSGLISAPQLSPDVENGFLFSVLQRVRLFAHATVHSLPKATQSESIFLEAIATLLLRTRSILRSNLRERLAADHVERDQRPKLT